MATAPRARHGQSEQSDGPLEHGVWPCSAFSDSRHRRSESGLALLELDPCALRRGFFAALASPGGWSEMAEALRVSRLLSARRGSLAGAIREFRCPDDDARGRLRGG